MATFIKHLIPAAAIALIAAACTQTDDGTPQGRAISFRPAAETRAAVEKDGTPADFLVWGGYGATHLLFDGETVHSPSWNYDGGTRYWVPGEWNFYAIHPKAALDGKVAFDNGTFTVTGFDASATGTEAVDLMAASTPVTYPEGGTPPTSVGLTFHHLLARVNVAVKSENSAVTIKSLRFCGINYKGDLTQTESTTAWSNTTACTADDTPFKMDTPFDLNINDGMIRENILGDMLLPTQQLTANAQFIITYRYTGETADHTATANIPANTSWESGQHYNYTVTLKAAGLTINVNILDWDDKDTSVSWGDGNSTPITQP